MEFRDAILLNEIATPATPAAGTDLIYPKSDKNWYTKDSDGNERLVSHKAPTQQVLTVGSGTYTTPAGCVAILVEVIAAGGGGGGVAGSATQAGAGSGGASGGYLRKLIAAPASSYAYTAGAKGAGGAAGANNGSAGADSTFGAGGSLLTAKGGGGGVAGTLGTTALASSVIPGGVPGGVATGGDINSDGQEGLPSYRTSATSSQSGAGAPSALGGGARRANSNADGQAATTKGAGGSGGRVESVNTARAGGDGADGLIIVTEHY